MRLELRSITTWAVAFGLLVFVPIVIFMVAPPALNIETGGDDGAFFALLVSMALGCAGLVGCAVAWQVRSAVRARLADRAIAPGEAAAVVPFLAFALWFSWGVEGAGSSATTVPIVVVAAGIAEGCALRVLSLPVARTVQRRRGARAAPPASDQSPEARRTNVGSAGVERPES